MATSDRSISYKYKSVGVDRYRPIIPIDIELNEIIRYEVLVDSGADYCMFDEEVAEAIGIEDIATGKMFTFGGVTGDKKVGYWHTVTLSIKGCTYQTKVGFSAEMRDDGYGIVGQKGFFDRFSIIFDYSNKTLTLMKKDWA